MLSFIEHGKIASKEETGMTSNGIYATTSPLISPICKSFVQFLQKRLLCDFFMIELQGPFLQMGEIKESFLEKLNERLATSDINQVKADVLPFVRNPKELNIWSNDYFIELAKLLKFD